MLGIGRKSTIEFSAYGKHPAFNDYFNLNINSPLANALSAWVEKGTKLKGEKKDTTMIRSFRFWVRGIKKEELVLGVVRDSSDRMGRTYPLLLMGKGPVKGWEPNWQSLFAQFEPVFRAFEEMTASRYEDFKAFEAKLAKIRFPDVCPGRRENRSMFKKKQATPGAGFLGGVPDNPGLTIYTRPLKAEDFLALFTVSKGGK